LRDEAGFRCMAEMLLARDGNDVFEFGKSHGLMLAKAGKRDASLKTI
jgi:hypothetical protein